MPLGLSKNRAVVTQIGRPAWSHQTERRQLHTVAGTSRSRTAVAISTDPGESVCVHGDSPGAVQIATAVRDRLVGEGVELAAFV